MQETPPGGGYHVWHCEIGPGSACNRALVYLLYLNDLTDAECGETEFMFQGRRVQPKANTMLVWPTGITHPHRGNPVYGENSKFVMTGWFYIPD